MRKIAAFIIIILAAALPNAVRAEFISAKSAIVINADTGEVLYSLEPKLRLPMASTTKIMTALLVFENGGLDETVTVTREMIAVEGTSMGLSVGDRLTRTDLLYGMLLVSGNDAANALAVSVGGTCDRFVTMMNSKAAKLGLENTGFATPSGLDGEGHYTCAYDLAMITRAALMYDGFKKIVSSESVTLTYGEPSCKRRLVNHNKLLKMYSDIIGVKTGFTKKAGRCLVSAAENDGKRVIAVTLNDGNDWEDHRKLLDAGFSALKQQTVQGFKVSVPVVGGQCRLEASAPEKSFCVSKNSNITEKLFAPAFLYPPVKKGEIIARAEYSLNGEVISREELAAQADIELKRDIAGEFTAIVASLLRSINER